ncbi:TonB family protein [Enterovirga aerilata]|uniref:TonB family protein n=1 Tax=Enterovirga aerilata TaxID=2730920 RepID=A0A849IAE9_9HYPH|nr:TonB family protein [Enterovirga sp. DB1703]
MSAIALSGPGDFDGGEVSRWAVSFAVVLGLHAAAFTAIVAYRSATIEPGEALPAVMIDMAPPPAAPTLAPSEAPPQEAVPEAAMPEPVLDAPPDVPEPDVAPPEPVLTAEVPPLEPLPEVPPVEELIPPTPIVRETAAVALPPPPKAAPKPKKVVEKKPEAKKPPKPVQARRAEQRQEARRPPQQQSGAQTTASIASNSSGSSAASRASWQGALVSHLRRHLRPQPGQTGAASVRFSVDRGGRVLSTSLVGSAGSPALDAEAIAVFRRAQPLPAPPAEVPGASFTFTVPIRFTVR